MKVHFRTFHLVHQKETYWGPRVQRAGEAGSQAKAREGAHALPLLAKHHRAASAQAWLFALLPRALVPHTFEFHTSTMPSVRKSLKLRLSPSPRFLFSKMHKGRSSERRDTAYL